MVDFKGFISYLGQLFQLTPLIAVITVVIAYQQWKTNRDKLKMDLYDRRYKIFTITRNFILFAMDGERRDSEKMGEFTTCTVESYFLFEEEIPDFLNIVYEKVKELDLCRRKLDNNENQVEDLDELELTLMQDVTALLRESRQKFGKYLSLRNI